LTLLKALPIRPAAGATDVPADDTLFFMDLEYQPLNGYNQDGKGVRSEMRKTLAALSLLAFLVFPAALQSSRYYGVSKAVADGDYSKVEQFLDSSPRVLGRAYYFEPPLTMIAAEKGRLKILQLLSENGFDPLRKGILWIDKNSFYGTPLCAAAGEGHLAMVRYLVETVGASVDGQEIMPDGTERGWTPLMWAASKNRKAIVKYLMKAGAEVKLKTDEGGTALYAAAALEGDGEMARLLLSHGATAVVATVDGLLPIHLAARRGSAELCRILLAAAPNTINAITLRSETPLFFAAGSGSVEACATLLKAGAEIDTTDAGGVTPLLAAVSAGKLEVVKFLASKGAKLKVRTKQGNTALHLAAYGGHSTVCEWLCPTVANLRRKNDLGETPLHLAAGAGDIDTVQFLLSAGSQVDSSSKEGLTPLFYAVMRNSQKCAGLLLQWKASTKKRDWYGWTPLHWAVLQRKASLVQPLLTAGGDPDATTNLGDTPLHFASEILNQNAVKLLLAAGADPNAVDSQGKTPLDYALRMANPYYENDVTKELKEAGGRSLNPGKKALFLKILSALNSGNFALMDSALNSGADPNYVAPGWLKPPLAQVAGVELPRIEGKGKPRKDEEGVNPEVKLALRLIRAGADVKERDSHGDTALHAAAGNGDLAFARLLLGKGADVDAKNLDGVTPLMTAAVEGDPSMVKLFLEKGASVNESSGELGTTPLASAVLGGSQQCVALLIKAGADPSAVIESGFNLIDFAVLSRSLEMVKYVLSLKLPTTNRNREVTPLDLSEIVGSKDITAFFKETGDFSEHQPVIDLWRSVRNEDPIKLRAAIRAGAGVNSRVFPGTSLLRMAVTTRQWNIIDTLLSEGADPSEKVPHARPDFVLLIQNSAPATLVKAFISHGVNVNISGDDGITPLMAASRLGRRDIIEILLQAGADVAAYDSEGKTALHYGVLSRLQDADLVKFLISKGADVEAKDNKGVTPLILCALERRPQILKVLLDADSPVNAADHDGNTALHAAAKYSWLRGVDLLLKAGADAETRNNKGLTPIGLALNDGARLAADRIRIYELEEESMKK